MREQGRARLAEARMNEWVATWLAAVGVQPLMGWAVTVRFYAALHYVDSYLIGVRCVRSPSHEMQDANIAADDALRKAQIGECFRELRKASISQRYQLQKFGRSEFKQIKRLYFDPIKREVERLNREAKLELCRDHSEQDSRGGWGWQ